MTEEKAITLLYDILDKHLNLPAIDAFHKEARLNEDLCMDSVMILQFILHLEVDYGIEVPDDQLAPSDFYTVSSMAQFICSLTKQNSIGDTL
ncbi:petrobactin biosynthesis protein AsbD [Alkalihalophilus marmarensis]|uniref:petrobactin biosynthesis protein AsbD n=1 Tax=Alkalihalophilus marmarensis TaxID=521377 RepID=UPI002DBF1BFA|nr:petrobactin biosynthesis protein AsbD [Alkalihalophilus marmarensis]MEC2071936.1 petrobactin biosynthesis protein AsbD [Alkalihalophilus marmarensis]